jgi:CO dehydrogenase maturation factor
MHNNNGKKPYIIAVCGKGGVGKTSISSIIAKIITGFDDKQVLAIDADPAVGLATALGIEVRKTVDDIRQNLINRLEHGQTGDKRELVNLLDYEMLTALEERGNLAMLAIGRPEKEGCYCQVNHILKDIIASISSQFDYVIIDGEAGVEQINRRVMEKVTHLLIVSDQSKKALEVAKTIQTVSQSTIYYEKTGLILNKIRNQNEANHLSARVKGFPFLGWVPESDFIREFDMQGRSILEMEETQSIRAVKSCLAHMGIMDDESGQLIKSSFEPIEKTIRAPLNS